MLWKLRPVLRAVIMVVIVLLLLAAVAYAGVYTYGLVEQIGGAEQPAR